MRKHPDFFADTELCRVLYVQACEQNSLVTYQMNALNVSTTHSFVLHLQRTWWNVTANGYGLVKVPACMTLKVSHHLISQLKRSNGSDPDAFKLFKRKTWYLSLVCFRDGA